MIRFEMGQTPEVYIIFDERFERAETIARL